jgi:hypothetical protein
VDNKKFHEEIVNYRERVEKAKEEGKEVPRLPEYLGECIWKMANKLSTMPRFMIYSFREEMISDGIENCIMYFHDYDPQRGVNPFAYFTQVIYYAFIRRISKEERNRYIVYKNFQETIINHGHSGLMTDSDDNNLIQNSLYDNISYFMARFVAKEQEKKDKRREKKAGLIKFYEDQKNEQ